MAPKMHKSTFKVKNNMVGHVIGKGGWRIEEIRRDTNTKIYFGKGGPDQNGDIECTITGREFQGVELAKIKILTIVNENFGKGKHFARPPIQLPIPDAVETRKVLKDISVRKNLGGSMDLVVKIHHTLVAHLIGKNGSRIKEISTGSNCQICLDKETDENGNVDCWIRSNDMASKERAKRMIEKYLTKFQEKIPTDNPDNDKETECADLILNIHHTIVAPLIGTKGCQIENIKHISKSEICFSKETDGKGYVECRIKSNNVANQVKAKENIKEFLTSFGKKKLKVHDGDQKIDKKNLKPVEKFKPASDAVASSEENQIARAKSKASWRGNKSCWRCDKKFGKSTNFDLPKRHSAKCVKLGNSKEAFQRNITKRREKLDSKCEWSGGCDICGNLFWEAKDFVSHLEGKGMRTNSKRGIRPTCLERLNASAMKTHVSKQRAFERQKNIVVPGRQFNYFSIKFKNSKLCINLYLEI